MSKQGKYGHLCEDLYNSYSSDKNLLITEENTKSTVNIRKYSKKIKRLRIGIASGILIIILALTAALVSFIKFDTPNFFASGISLIRIAASDTPYIEIQNNPRVIVAQPENAMQLFLDTIEAKGYTYLEEERLGSMHVIEKDGRKEYVHFSVNRYFSKWSWE